jgi:hypothetical protein
MTVLTRARRNGNVKTSPIRASSKKKAKKKTHWECVEPTLEIHVYMASFVPLLFFCTKLYHCHALANKGVNYTSLHSPRISTTHSPSCQAFRVKLQLGKRRCSPRSKGEYNPVTFETLAVPTHHACRPPILIFHESDDLLVLDHPPAHLPHAREKDPHRPRCFCPTSFGIKVTTVIRERTNALGIRVRVRVRQRGGGVGGGA